MTGELVDWINQHHIATPGVEAVVQSLKERHEAGLAKYGQPLYVAEGPPSRPPVVDLAQELLDALVYAMQAKLYGWPCPTVAESDVLQLCVDALAVLQGLMADQKP